MPGELDRIAHTVHQNLFDFAVVCPNPRQVVGQIDPAVDASFNDVVCHNDLNGSHDFGEIYFLFVEVGVAGFHFFQVKDVVDQRE